jgi:dihydroorotate dehydrogenase
MAVGSLQLLPPEAAHRLAIWALGRGLVPALPQEEHVGLTTSLLGYPLPNPLGLAAGFDKDAEALPGLARLGFGFLEVGTITPRPQRGNLRPRLFRLRRQRALINRMGFNNHGLEAARKCLSARDPAWGVIGANIGAGRDSEDPITDYVACLAGLYELVDYVTINVSSPNTPGLRALQTRSRLKALLAAMKAERDRLASMPPSRFPAAAVARRPAASEPPVHHKPLLLKIAPDLSAADEAAIAELALAFGVDGLIIANTTIARPDIVTGRRRDEAGGLSGTPLFLRSTEQLARLFRLTAGRLPLVGVGGITNGADAYAKIRAGATALQLYTALVYQGPAVIGRVLGELTKLLERDGVAHYHDAIGVDAAR